jgi:hypothetical protein
LWVSTIALEPVQGSITFSTITNNRADSDNNGTGDGGGLFTTLPVTLSVDSTIIAGNRDGGQQAPDCKAQVTSLGANIIGDQAEAACQGFNAPGDQVGNRLSTSGVLDPQLNSLAANGGATLTHAPRTNSPALDKGRTDTCPATDQRGVLRPQGSRCDVGAVEMVAPTGSLAGFVYEDLNMNGAKDADEIGIGGVTVSLTGIRANGVTVAFTMTTGDDGAYRFVNILVGTYSIKAVQPQGHADGTGTIGSLGGTLGDNEISAIVVAGGETGTGYNFGKGPLVVTPSPSPAPSPSPSPTTPPIPGRVPKPKAYLSLMLRP